MATYVNNHIHTTYSFSPYTPAAAVEAAMKSGLKTAGIIDHDSVGGAKEFIEAGQRFGMPVTVGVECRVDMSATPLNGKRLNNPDQKSVAYVTMHGIPHQNIDKVDAFFAPYREKRNQRNRIMCQNISTLTAPYHITLDFDRDVLPLATATVTERHILFALVKKIVAIYDTPEKVVDFICNTMDISLSEKVKAQILAGRETPEFYEYDILGALKGNMVEKFYVDATDELPDVREFIKVAHENGAVAAYAYLGDIGDSVTGDKKAQKFEDDYLDLLFEVIADLGFDAVTFMPSRNTPAQLDRLMAMCEEKGFFQISGEDINTPRQSFICKAYENPKFQHLVDAAFMLIAYENAATEDIASAKKQYPQMFRY